MIDKIKAVQNPLTIIAIFAALAEVAGTVALATVDRSLQSTFVWFVMAFPTLLVLLFFATLNFNAKVLYAPSDFRDEENFLSTLAGPRDIKESFKGLNEQLELTKQRLLSESLKEIHNATEGERKKVTEIINEQLEELRAKVESTKESAIETTIATAQAVVRCEHCKLVQFANSKGQCRRCHMKIPEILAHTD